MERKEHRTTFYIRTETATEVRVEWKTLPRYILAVGMILFFFFSYLTNTTHDIEREFTFSFIGFLCFFLTMIYSAIYFIRTWGVSQEIKAAREEGFVEVSGKNGSFAHPMVVSIRKQVVAKSSDSNRNSTKETVLPKREDKILPQKFSEQPKHIAQSTQVVNMSQQICFCRKCGKKLIDGSAFCSYCGTAVIKE